MMNTNKLTYEQVQELKPEQVTSVYSGKPGCACGCRGNYRYNPEHIAYSSKERGYKVEAEEVNYAQVKKVLKIVKQHLVDDERAAYQNFGDHWASVTVTNDSGNERIYVVYIKEAK